jgi:hypothetical protein
MGVLGGVCDVMLTSAQSRGRLLKCRRGAKYRTLPNLHPATHLVAPAGRLHKLGAVDELSQAVLVLGEGEKVVLLAV